MQSQIAVDDQPGPTPPAPGSAVPVLPPLPEPRNFSRWLLFGSVIISGLLHVAGAAAMLLGDAALPDYGVLTQQTDAISIEMTASTILEAVESTASTAAAASVPTATQEGNPTPSSAAAVPLTKVEETAVETPVTETVKAPEVNPDAVTPPDDPLEVVKGAGEPSDVVDAQVAQQAKDEEQKQEKKEKIEKEKEQVKVDQQQAAPQVSGGVTARSTASVDSQAKVSASRGSILSYAAGIRAKVARNKPTGLGRSGEVEISFGVTPTGDLAYANLAQSSGNTRLDEASLEAIRRSAPFGPPPTDASPSQLRFSIPFYFR
jgi:periplasmic protein TonB